MFEMCSAEFVNQQAPDQSGYQKFRSAVVDVSVCFFPSNIKKKN